ncbi:MAG: ion transporter [Ruminococcaceae bacterium]|nr:ion transporter [Oscillospiraceae bacterium]
MKRDKIYSLIDGDVGTNKLSPVYDYFMMVIIIISLIPLAFKTKTIAFDIIDAVTVTVFIIDYILRFITADKHLEKGALSFLLYPITPLAIVDLISILPSLSILSSGFRIFKLFRLFRTFRVFKAFKMLRYSKSVIIILNVIKKQKTALIAVLSFAIGYILIASLVVFNVEPDTFNSFFDAIYWATVSLTTVGYGDIYPISSAGRIVTMVSSFIGIAIVALPSGILTAGYMNEIKNSDDE